MINALEQIKLLHSRTGESLKERTKLFKRLDTIADRDEAIADAIANAKSIDPFYKK